MTGVRRGRVRGSDVLESTYETLRLVFDGDKTARDLSECTGLTPDVVRRRMKAAEKTGLITITKERSKDRRLQTVFKRAR